MADPTSISPIVGETARMVAQCGKTIWKIYDLSERFKYAKLTITSLASGLETVQRTWGRIANILEDSANDPEVWQYDVVAQLNRSLDGGSLVISALEEDLKSYDGMPEHAKFGLRARAKVLWEEQNLKDHHERIRDQVNSTNLLLSVLRMPKATSRQSLLAEGHKIFRMSDQSAYSIVPSRAPRSYRGDISRSSMRSEKSFAYHERSIDDDLFTARVYKRNYRNSTIMRRMFQGPKETSTPPKGGLDPESTKEIEALNDHLVPEQYQSLTTRSRGFAEPFTGIVDSQRNHIDTRKELPKLPSAVDEALEF